MDTYRIAELLTEAKEHIRRNSSGATEKCMAELCDALEAAQAQNIEDRADYDSNRKLLYKQAVDATAERDAALAEVGRLTEAKDRLTTIVDEAFGLQPVMTLDDLLTLLERELHRSHVSNETLRSALVKERAISKCLARALAPFGEKGDLLGLANRRDGRLVCARRELADYEAHANDTLAALAPPERSDDDQ